MVAAWMVVAGAAVFLLVGSIAWWVIGLALVLLWKWCRHLGHVELGYAIVATDPPIESPNDSAAEGDTMDQEADERTLTV